MRTNFQYPYFGGLFPVGDHRERPVRRAGVLGGPMISKARLGLLFVAFRDVKPYVSPFEETAEE